MFCIKNTKFMSDKYKNRYRVETTRVKWHNYAEGTYFVTICTKNKVRYFGEIYDDTMYFTGIGEYAESCVKEINEHFPIAEVLEYVVMPNHIHLLIHIDSSRLSTDINTFGPQSQNLASIIRGFKVGVTKYARSNNMEFSWQDRYHDHIIRNQNELNRISDYIKNNVINWWW